MMMAMGVSTHSSPFIPPRPSLFNLSRSSSSAKALHRRGRHMTHRPQRTFPNITAHRSFFHLKYSSHSHAWQEKRLIYSGELSIYNGEENSSSKARMLVHRAYPDSSSGKHTFDGSWARIEEENEQAYRGMNLPPGHKAGFISDIRISASGSTPRATPLGSQVLGHSSNMKTWSQECDDLRKLKEEMFKSIRRKTSEKDTSLDRVSQNPQQLYKFSSEKSQPTWPVTSTRSSFQVIVNTEDGDLVVQARETGLALEDRSYIDVQHKEPLKEISLKVREKIDSRPTGGGHVQSDENSVINGKTIGKVKKGQDSKLVGNAIDHAMKKNVTPDSHKQLSSIYDDVLVVNTVSAAKKVVRMLTDRYKHLVHACDTEVAKIDVKVETPVDHGEVTCFSIYSGPEADFGNGKSSIWVDVLDGGGREILLEFAPFFEDPSIKKVWHNYSFDNHVLENYGFKLSGFHADTMHMARLWDSSRRTKGGYSLEALTGDSKVMSGVKLCPSEKDLIGKISMKTIFGKKKIKKDGTEGKMVTMVPVEELQRNEHKLWVSYSALDAISTLKLYESLKSKLSLMPWKLNEVTVHGKTMFDFYEEYWRPFGEVLVKMETEGMLVDRGYLAELEKVAKGEQEIAVNRFRNWASKYCPDAKYMNVGSDAQLRQLFFGGMQNRNNSNEYLPDERTFKIPNVDNIIEEGKKTPTKFRNITLCKIGAELTTEIFTATGWPSVSGDALKTLAGKVSADYDFADCDDDLPLDDDTEIAVIEDVDTSAYGTAYTAFVESGYKEEEAREACHAIAALCEVCSIDSLISNFILPLQGSNVSGKNGRVHCSLNINTETGRLSARRPNLQNQPALEKDRYKIRQAFIASPGNSLVVADYGQLELRILAHLADCQSMLEAFKAGGDFHSRTAMNMYPHIREAVENREVLLEWDPQPGEDKPPVPLLKDAFGSERRKAKMLNFSIAYGKTAVGLARDWKVPVKEAQEIVNLWYKDRPEVLAWQQKRKREAVLMGFVYTLLGRKRDFPSTARATRAQKGHIERAAINTPVQGSAADVAMCAMLEITTNARLKELGWKLVLQVHDEVILEGPTESAEIAKAIVVDCMSKPFKGKNILKVDLAVDAKCAQNWYAAK